MKSTVRSTWSAALGFAAVALVLPLAAQSRATKAETSSGSERFTALAVNMNGVRTGTTQVEIVVDRWSTDAERDRFINTLLEKGPEKLLDVLQDSPKVGYIRPTSGTGWDLHYARHTPLPDRGERVVVATDRPIGTAEAFNQGRTLDYPFTVVEMHLNANGEGEGKMSYATKITGDKESGTIILENWGTQPVLLQGVKRERPTN
jgi:hypothetical protein